MELKEIRRQSCLSQTAFAKETGIPVASVRNWEQGRYKTPGYIKSLVYENLRFKGYVITEHRPDTIDEIKSVLIPIAKKHNVSKVVLFGSRARGDFDGKSDYDFLIVGDNTTGPFMSSAFENHVRDTLDVPIDFVSDKTVDDYILEDIKREGVLIYEAQRRDDMQKDYQVLR